MIDKSIWTEVFLSCRTQQKATGKKFGLPCCTWQGTVVDEHAVERSSSYASDIQLRMKYIKEKVKKKNKVVLISNRKGTLNV